MKNRLVNKILNLLNHDNNNTRSIYFAIISITAFFISKYLGFNATIIILVCITTMVAFATIIQILRKDKNRRNIVIYLFITFLLVFVTSIVWMMQYYLKADNDVMFFKIISIFLSVIAIIADILCVLALLHKNSSKLKKISLIVVAIYMTLISILSIIFLPFNK